jgi:hypothetical protein
VKRYNPDRSGDWNYGGNKWRLSRSKIELFVECPRCFYLDNKLGTGRPRGPAFTLNIAVDALLKKEFDTHRANGTKHPLMEHYGLDAVPFSDPRLNVWRENFKGVACTHAQTGLVVSGAVDDIWVTSKKELVVVDYKATAKSGKIESLDDSGWKEQYARQVGVYQWLLRQNGLQVSDTSYFLYANGMYDKEAFDGQLEFDLTLVPLKGDTAWIEPTLAEIKKCLDADALPPVGANCEFCVYREAAGKKLQALAKKK